MSTAQSGPPDEPGPGAGDGLAGLVDNKVCAIDGTWSALRLVIRREHR